MPSADTFSIEPIRLLLKRWLADRTCIVDPFARNSALAHRTNDLNPETSAQYHMDAVDFLASDIFNARPDAVLIDPPYSVRQVSECYQQVGRAVTMQDTQASFWTRVKDATDLLMSNSGIVICCGWNSSGMGVVRGYELEEILLVCHGGVHNDTIVTVERKVFTVGRLSFEAQRGE